MHAPVHTGRTVRHLATGCVAVLLLAGCSGNSVTPNSGSTTPGPAGPSTPTSAPSSNVSTSGTGAAAVTLRITSLREGQTITLPADIGYRTDGVTVDSSAGYKLKVRADRRAFTLPISSSVGTVTLPRDKFLPGRRTLTFTLVHPGHPSTAADAEAVVIHDVMIIGPK